MPIHICLFKIKRGNFYIFLLKQYMLTVKTKSYHAEM